MGIAADILDDWDASFAACLWLQELGVLEPVGEAPVDRYALPAQDPFALRGATPAISPASRAAPQQPRQAPAPQAAPPTAPKVDPVAEARRLAETAPDLAALRAAIEGFAHCEIKQGARNTVFADGNDKARVMIVGEAPGADEDRQGLPFVGKAGQMLDRMFACIGLGRAHPDPAQALYITNVMPWRPPGNRDPSVAEIAMMVPFVQRHVSLIDPDLIVVMGNIPAQAVLGQRGITRLRGQWLEAWDRPVLPMLHPAYLLRNPVAKREAWADLLALQARLRGP